MHEQCDVPLAGFTTLHLGGPARRLVVATTEAEIVDTVRTADAAREPLLILGGGSNLVIADTGFDGTVLQIASVGVAEGAVGAHSLQVQAGVDWDHLVALTIEQAYAGLEALSGIPGRTGAAPIQNVGAYGQEVSQALVEVRALDRTTGDVVTLTATDCELGYRDSIFKRTGRYVVLAVTFGLEHNSNGAAIRYAELARSLGVEIGDRAPAADVRAAVLDLRRSKGMVLDPGGTTTPDHDTWSAGSFFTNPILSAGAAATLPVGAPRWSAGDDRIKTSAAWLIEHAGFARGYGHGPVRVSTKHTLALTNRGTATTADLLDLAREIRARVLTTFGVLLDPEPVLVGVTL